MQDKRKTKTQLVRELRTLHAKLKRLEKSEDERRRLVDELRESEERYHLIVDNSDDAIFLTVPDGRILAANPAACKMFGRTEAEICRLGRNGIVDPTDPRIAEVLNDRARTGRFKGELTLLHRGGQPFPAEVTTSVFRDRAGHQRTSMLIRDITEHKRAEEALDRERSLLRALMDNIPDHIYFKDSASRFVRINKALADRFGLSNPVQAVGKMDFDFFTEEHARTAYEDEQGIVRTGQPLVGLEEKETWPDGRETWVSTTKMPLRDRAGQIIGTFGISRDITDRKGAEEALRGSEEKYKILFAGAREAIFIAEAESGIILDCNEAACSLIERPKEELIGKHQSTLHPPDELVGDFSDSFRRHLTNELGHVLNARVVTKCGVFKDVEIKANVLDLRGKKIIQGFFSDITERKQAEEALAAERNLLSTMMNALPDRIYVKDIESRFMLNNLAHIRALGAQSQEDVLGKTDYDFRPPDLADRYVADDRRVIQSGQPLIGREELTPLSTGGRGWLSVNKVPLRDPEGKIIGLVAISRDITERKQAEQRLEEERNLLRTIIDAIPDAIAVKNTGRRFVLANRAAVRALKRDSEDEIIARKDEDLIPESVSRQAIGEEENVLATGRPFFDNVGRSKINPETDEIERCILISKIPLREQSGEVTGLVGIDRDVTELKQAEEMLEKERTLLLTLIESIPDEVCLKDLRHRYLVANRASMKALGVTSVQALIGKTDHDFVPQDLAQEHVAEEEAILESGEPLINRERTMVDPNTGEIEKCLLTTKVPVKDNTGKAVGILVVNRHITERKRAEEALRASEEKFRALFEESKDIVYFSTVEGKLLDINAAGIELLGYASKQEMLQIDLTHAGYADAKDKKRFERQMDQQGFVKDFEVVLRRKDGGKLTVLETATAVRDNQGRIVQYRGIMRDITKQRQLERQFIQAQKMESIGTLAGGIAHDFNNILAIILGHITLVERYKDTPAKLAHSVKTMAAAVERGTALVRQLLTFARKTQTLLESVRVNEVIEELMKLLRETFPTTIDISAQLDPKVPSIDGDPTQIQQVLLNLSVNARDAMPMGGSLTFTTRLVSGEELAKRFLDAHERSYVGISMRDTGIGMDEATKSHIFEPFFTTKELGKGTGLGLSVVYGIVGAHRGFIEVESTLQAGSTFHLYLPASRTIHETFREKRAAAEEVRGGTETVLVVEDEEALRELAKQALVEKGYRVIEARDGNQAVELYKARWDQVDLVVSDMGLPKIGGYDVFLEMKSKNPRVKMVLASGYLEPELKLEILRSGVKDFIQKPYTREALLKCVRDVLDFRG